MEMLVIPVIRCTEAPCDVAPGKSGRTRVEADLLVRIFHEGYNMDETGGASPHEMVTRTEQALA